MAQTFPTNDSAVGTPVDVFNEALAVSASSSADIVSYTVPANKKLLLSLVDFSGENIAVYEVQIDATAVGKKHTYFSGALHGEFFFYGKEVLASSIVKLRVNNFRSEAADFSGRIVGRLKND